MKVKVSLRKVRLNQGGYDSKGEYFGIGMPLYVYTFEDGTRIHERYLRAETREKAKELIEHWNNMAVLFYGQQKPFDIQF